MIIGRMRRRGKASTRAMPIQFGAGANARIVSASPIACWHFTVCGFPTGRAHPFCSRRSPGRARSSRTLVISGRRRKSCPAEFAIPSRPTFSKRWMPTMVEDIPAFTRVTLLTGFLGSGKTTLLRRLLADPALKDTAVIINELGEVGIDHLLVERLDDQMVLLSSGCVCCTVRGELATTMRDLHSRRERGLVPPFRRLVIESTGLADPFPVLSTLKADPVLRHHFRAAGVVTTVDAVNGFGQLDRYIESVRQVAVADAIVLTKSDIAEEAVTARLAARLDAINPSAPRLSAADAPLDADALLQAGGSGWFKAIAEPSMAMAAHAGVRAFSIIVHAPPHLSRWPSEDHRSRLVFIVEGIEPDLVRRSFSIFNRLNMSVAAKRS